MGKAISGLRIVGGPNKADDPVNRGNLARVAEAVERDLTEMEDRLSASESNPPFRDLGNMASDNVKVGALPETQNGFVTFIDTDGVRKVGFRFNGELLMLTTY